MADNDPTRYLAEIVRAADRPRYYAALFAPEDRRADLFALYAFAAEVARAPDQVREPRLGEIRLQWWRDSLEAAVEPGGAGASPVVTVLTETIRRRALPLAPLMALVEARRADLYADPPGTVAELEGYLGETESALFQLAALVLGSPGAETAEAAGYAGIAYGLTRRLAALPKDRAHGRSIVPAALLAAEGLAATSLFESDPQRQLARPIATLAEIARDRLRLARQAAAGLPRSVLPAFLPLATTSALLSRVAALGPELATQGAEISDVQALLRLGWARIRGISD